MAFGQTGGVNAPPPLNVNPPAGAPPGSPGIALSASGPSVIPNNPFAILVTVVGGQGPGGVSGDFTLELAQPLGAIFQTKVTSRNVNVTTNLPSTLNITSAASSKGSTSVSGRSVTTSIGDLAAGETVTININSVGSASGASEGDVALIKSTLIAQVIGANGALTSVTESATLGGGAALEAVGLSGGTSSGGTRNTPAAGTAGQGGGTIPGLPNTGSNQANSEGFNWQILAGSFLFLVIVSSLFVILRNRRHLKSR